MPTEEALALIPHRNYDVAETLLFVGKRGMGKTWGIRERIEDREPRILLFDPFDDFKAIAVSPTIDEALYDLNYWPEACRRRIIPPIGDDSLDFAEDVFARLIEGTPETGNQGTRNVLIGLDEIGLWSKFQPSKRFITLIRQGRRLGIKMLIASQRLAEVPAALLSEATEIVAFKFTRPRDLEVLEFWSDSQTAGLCRNLSVGECILLSL